MRQFFVTSSETDRFLDMKKNFKKYLVFAIRLLKSPVKFWKHLACSHFIRDTMEWPYAKNGDFASKDMNQQNCPELRALEKFWPIVERIIK